MRVPWDVAETPNAYLAFRAVILAGIHELCFVKKELIASAKSIHPGQLEQPGQTDLG